MKLVRGTNVYPRAIEAIVREFPEVDEFQTRDHARGDPRRDHAARRAEAGLAARASGTTLVGRAPPAAALAHEGLNFRIERAGEGELPRFELKAKRTVDQRDAPIGAARVR